MADLSPAAQAVLKAACIHHGLFNEEIVQRRRMLAAALRAVADQLGESRAPGLEFEDLYARIIEVDELLAIAAELDSALP